FRAHGITDCRIRDRKSVREWAQRLQPTSRLTRNDQDNPAMTLGDDHPRQIRQRQALPPDSLCFKHVIYGKCFLQNTLQVRPEIGAMASNHRIRSAIEHGEWLQCPDINPNDSRLRDINCDRLHPYYRPAASKAPDAQAVV